MRFLFILLLIANSSLAFSQKEERKNLRSGNKEYQKENYAGAEADYRKALESNPSSLQGYYNLGNSLYKQLQPEPNREITEEEKAQMNEAIQQYKTVIQLSQDKKEKAMAWHNMGNIFMLTGNYKQSVEAYKNSLLNNPEDHETRYNYILAKKLLKDQEDQQDQNQNQQQDQDQEQQQQEQNQQNQEQEQEQNQDQQQPQNDKMSRENAEQILNALMQQEQETQEKKQQKVQPQSKNRPEKDW
ncbi:MAG: tetratricopeptide repeat protein [Candidatus Azobacteroides sp.]|nr:tetratricopeptide repeat protein [Candidatus Azobacteroides sp.]